MSDRWTGQWPRALSLRLALMFALVSVMLLGSLGFYLYQSLEREIAWRDDQALIGRVERMRTLIGDSDSIEALRKRPQLYANMLGNRDNLLWVLDAAGQPLIEINPTGLPVPLLPPGLGVQLQDGGENSSDKSGKEPARLAWQHVNYEGQALTLVAGKLLANLIANALRYGSADSPVRITSQMLDSQIEISVSNSGEPIAPEHLPRLFDRFYRCNPARSQPGDSGGLGLAIVRSILQMHGGFVHVDSNATGTCFTLRFPVRD